MNHFICSHRFRYLLLWVWPLCLGLSIAAARADGLPGTFPPGTSPPEIAATSIATEISGATVTQVQSGQAIEPETLLRKLAQADVVYLGETHDREADHQIQLAILKALHQQALHSHRRLAIGMEMFQRPYQQVLDRYLLSRITETELQTQSQYAKRWGYPWEFYAPILRFAQTNRLPILALNTPTEITRRVARQGLESLTWADYRYVPPRSAIVLAPEGYRQRMRQIYEQIHHGKSSSASFDRFFQSQVLWDETMAEAIARTLQKSPGTLMVVLVGQGHLLYGDGIPSRVARRMPQRRSPLAQVSVLLNPSEALLSEAPISEARTEQAMQEPGKGRSPNQPPIADYFWRN